MWGGSYIRQTVLASSNIASYPNAITGIGDINGDGYDDFSIGYAIGGNDISSYTVTIYYGNQERLYTNPLVLTQTVNQITCICKPLGDVNGDGYDDFLGYVDYLGLKLWMGNDTSLSSTPDAILNPLYFGSLSVEGVEAGDINGDGYDDVVGANAYEQRFVVWLGSVTPEGFMDWRKTSMYDDFGDDLAMGDFNGDGYADVAASAPWEDPVNPLHAIS